MSLLKTDFDLKVPFQSYPDIFESSTFSFRVQKFPRPDVAYSNRIRLSTRLQPIASDGIGIRQTNTLCGPVGLWFGRRLNTILLTLRADSKHMYPVRKGSACRVGSTSSSDSKIFGFTVHTLSDSLRINVFHSGERIQNNRIRCRVDGNRIQKERGAD